MKTQKKRFPDEFVNKALPIIKEYLEEVRKSKDPICEELCKKYNLSEIELVKILNHRRSIEMQHIREIRAKNALNAQ